MAPWTVVRVRRGCRSRCLSFVFENRETVWYQIREMIRAESIVDGDEIADEMTVHNALLPRPGELAATTPAARGRLAEDLA